MLVYRDFLAWLAAQVPGFKKLLSNMDFNMEIS